MLVPKNGPLLLDICGDRNRAQEEPREDSDESNERNPHPGGVLQPVSNRLTVGKMRNLTGS